LIKKASRGTMLTLRIDFDRLDRRLKSILGKIRDSAIILDLIIPLEISSGDAVFFALCS